MYSYCKCNRSALGPSNIKSVDFLNGFILEREGDRNVMTRSQGEHLFYKAPPCWRDKVGQSEWNIRYQGRGQREGAY